MAKRTPPPYSSLDANYPGENHPCDQGWDNQCAIRVSIALIDSGFHLTGYTEGPTCSHGHARGAQSLGDYLWKKIRRPRIFEDPSAAQTGTAQRSGIIVFKDIAGFRSGRGDHIDLWDGSTTRTGTYFQQATQVWFWDLTPEPSGNGAE